MKTTTAVLLVLALAAPVAAQTAVAVGCGQSLVCQQQRVLDLRDYREFLEEQLALAKALLREAQRDVATKDAELKALRGDVAPQRDRQ